jgi:anti-sigma B factor antagonist
MTVQSSTPHLDVETGAQGPQVKLASDAFEEGNLQRVSEQLVRLAEDLTGQELHLDLDSVKYLGSMGLAKLVALHKKVRARDGRLVLVNVDPSVLEVFQITHLHKVLDLRPKEAG